MKIAIISLFRKDFGGGCGRVAHDMADQLSSRHQVAVVCPADRTEQHQIPGGPTVLGIQSTGQGHACVPRLSRRDVNALFDFLDQFAPDVVHSHDPISLGLLGQVWAAMNNVPFVYTAHILPSKSLDFGASQVFEFLPHSWTENIGRRMLSDFMQNCDAIIALNQPAADDIRGYVYNGTLLTIPNGRDVAQLGTCRVADVSAPIKTLTFVGFISRRKNQAYLLEVMKHLPPASYHLQIIGEALEPDYSARVVEWAQEQGLSNVSFVGPVPYSEIPSYLERTHLFVSASTMEVQSLSVIEALASGTPVVGLANETIDELVDDRVGFRLDSLTDPEGFAQRVHEICALPQPAYEELCHNARRRVEHLNWSHIQEQTTAAYQRLIEQHQRPRSDVQIARIIERISSQEVQELLVARLERLNQTLRTKVHPRSRLGLLTRLTYAHHVPRTTWFYVGLTRVVSSLIYGFS